MTIDMEGDHKRQIIDYIFTQKEVPSEIMEEFSRWLIENDGDAETESILLEKWEEYSGTLFEENDLQGLKTARKRLQNSNRNHKHKAVMAIAAIAVFCCGFMSAALLTDREKEITLVTAKNDIGEFVLPDGTKVWLNGESRLAYPEKFDRRERAVSLCGEGYFEVIKDSRRPFRLTMQNLDVEVLGTTFGASCYEKGKTEEVILKSGSVKVTGDAMKNPVVLNPDEKLSYSPFNGHVTVEKVATKDTYRWYEDYLAFDNARFGDIIANISHRYQVDVKFLTSVSIDKRLSITITHENLESVMDVISSLLPIRYEIIEDTLIIKDKYTKR